jgi:replication factor C subunit 3/5
LKELYGPGVEKIKIDARVFQTTSNRKLEFNIVASVYHLEITPSDVGNFDRVVIQDLLKEVAQTQQVDLAAKQRFKVVVINEADHLTRDAQAALRRTMEKYSPNLRLILLANSTSNIIAPIRSRTLLVRVAAPSVEEICDVLESVGKKESWAVVKGLNERIAKESGRNLRKALLMFEAVHAQKYVNFSSLTYSAEHSTNIEQRNPHSYNTHSAPRLGCPNCIHRIPDSNRALTGPDLASPRPALRPPIPLHRPYHYYQNAHLETHTEDGRRDQARGGEMGGIL